MLTKWLRSDTAKLAEVAGQAGLTPEDAIRAITMGSKLIAYGFSEAEFENMRYDYMETRRKAWERWGL